MKKTMMISTLLALLIQTGCSAGGEPVESAQLDSYILSVSGIAEDADYQEYKKLEADGELNEGFYAEMLETEADSVPVETEIGQVHVTFAENPYIEVEYFRDAELSESLGTQNCYLNPGDCIYAKSPEAKSSYTNLYGFSTFRIYRFDGENGEAELYENGEYDPYSGLVFQIPQDYEGTELSVVPVGEYQNRTIQLNDTCIDEEGREWDPHGTWYVNGKETYNDSVEISPVEAYIITYHYDNETYFFVRSAPECHAQSEGEVNFEKAAASGETEIYSVQLCPYFSAEISFGSWLSGKIVVRGKDNQEIEDMGKSFTLKNKVTVDKLAYGDTIEIISEKECEPSSENSHLSEPKVEHTQGKYRYTFKVEE